MSNIKYNTIEVLNIIEQYMTSHPLNDDSYISIEGLYNDIVMYANQVCHNSPMPKFAQARKIIINCLKIHGRIKNDERLTTQVAYRLTDLYYCTDDIEKVLENEYDISIYSDDVIIYTPESLKEPYNNIMFGAIIAQDCVVRLNKVNPFSGLNTYNKGIGNQNKIINRIIKDYDMTKDEFLESFDFVNQWLTYDDNLGVGDPYYVENVTRFIPNASTDGIYIKYIKDGEVYTNKIYIDKTLQKNVKKY